MIERAIYNKGRLVVTKVSGKVHGQELFDHLFWLIDSHNIGEVQSGYAQLVYTENIESMTIKEEDIHRIMQISTGLGQGRGKFKTAILTLESGDIKLALLYKSLASEADLEAELFDNFDDAFTWLGCDNPDPGKYRLFPHGQD